MLVLVSQVFPQTIRTTGFNLEPHFQAFYMEQVVTFSWKSLNSFVLLKFFEAHVALAEASFSISV
jgi:hypothetical protein